jgi:pimeloyl-ACP methyl ester carboxylesterase
MDYSSWTPAQAATRGQRPEGRNAVDILLIPGLWLDGSSWERVVPGLERAGLRAHPITLPGMESRDADRSGITLRDHVDAVVAAIDAVAPAAGKVVLVGHSAGAAIAHAAVDARPDRVARAVYVGGFPTANGDAIAADYPAEHGEVPLPAWSAFAAEDLADLDDEARAAFRSRAIPSPARVARDPQRLADERRYDVPVTVIATEFTGEMLRGWIAQGEQPVRELARIRDVAYVDLPTGHWPQFTRPEELGRAIMDAAGTPPQGHPEPPLAGDEVATLLGSLERQRATFAWKCRGLDAAGLRATVGASSMTLGGLLKHLALVEESTFARKLHGRQLGPPWNRVDWEADPDWDWHSAAEDTPEQLLTRWQDAVDRSRSLVAEALADGGPEQLSRYPWPDGQAPSLRRILVDLIEEYARHVGHADLIRESVDGLIGEDPTDNPYPYELPARGGRA